MLRKIAFFTLAATMVFTAVACGGSTKPSHKALPIATASDVKAEGATTTGPTAKTSDAAKKTSTKPAAPATASQTPTPPNQADPVVTMPPSFPITPGNQCIH